MKVYLAAAFSRQKEIKEIAVELKELGIEVTSRWLDEEPMEKTTTAVARERALIDIADLRAADMVVRFTDTVAQSRDRVSSRLISGARMFEFGMAWERGMPVIVVGGTQNVFDYLPNVIHLPNVKALFQFLKGEKTTINAL